MLFFGKSLTVWMGAPQITYLVHYYRGTHIIFLCRFPYIGIHTYQLNVYVCLVLNVQQTLRQTVCLPLLMLGAGSFIAPYPGDDDYIKPEKREVIHECSLLLLLLPLLLALTIREQGGSPQANCTEGDVRTYACN